MGASRGGVRAGRDTGRSTASDCLPSTHSLCLSSKDAVEGWEGMAKQIIGRGRRVSLPSLLIVINQGLLLTMRGGMLGGINHYRVSRGGVEGGQPSHAAELN